MWVGGKVELRKGIEEHQVSLYLIRIQEGQIKASCKKIHPWQTKFYIEAIQASGSTYPLHSHPKKDKQQKVVVLLWAIYS
jgi:hypothetical protein